MSSIQFSKSTYHLGLKLVKEGWNAHIGDYTEPSMMCGNSWWKREGYNEPTFSILVNHYLTKSRLNKYEQYRFFRYFFHEGAQNCEVHWLGDMCLVRFSDIYKSKFMKWEPKKPELKVPFKCGGIIEEYEPNDIYLLNYNDWGTLTVEKESLSDLDIKMKEEKWTIVDEKTIIHEDGEGYTFTINVK